jgi:hypothetical protein
VFREVYRVKGKGLGLGRKYLFNEGNDAVLNDCAV